MVKPSEHLQRGRKKRNMLFFRLELAMDIGSFCSRLKAGGRSRSAEHILLDRLNSNLGHWPIHVSKKGTCYICMAAIQNQGLPIVGYKHESHIV